MIRTKHFAMNWGYNFTHDLPASFAIGLIANPGWAQGEMRPRWRFLIGASWSWLPQIVWLQEEWDHKFIERGLIVPNLGYRSSTWTGRKFTVHSWSWPFHFAWSWR